jgi:hypothetical protein
MLAFTGHGEDPRLRHRARREFAEEEAKKGMIKGKVSYLSPEQIYVRPFDAARRTWFALGVVFHEMLTRAAAVPVEERHHQDARAAGRRRSAARSAIDAMIPRELDRHRDEVAGDRSEGSIPRRRPTRRPDPGARR